MKWIVSGFVCTCCFYFDRKKLNENQDRLYEHLLILKLTEMNAIATLNETEARDISTTDLAIKYVGVGIFEENDGLLAVLLSIYYLAYVISISIFLLSIFGYYIPAKDLLQSIKVSCIVCSVAFQIGTTVWFINIHCSFVTHSWIPPSISKDICYETSQTIATFSLALGYLLFLQLFFARLVGAFKDSMFEISIKTKKSMKIVLFVLLVFYLTALIMMTMSYVLKSNNYWYLYSFSKLFLGINMIGYIITSILLVKLMFSRIEQFTAFVSNNDRSSELKKTGVQRASQDLVKLLTVLYTVALISSTLMLFAIIVFAVIGAIIGSNNTDRESGSHWRTNVVTYMLFSFSRLFFMIDSMINSLCLLLQVNDARHLYPKLCFICNRFSCLRMYS